MRGMVEKWDPVLGLQDSWDLRDPGTPGTPETLKLPVPQDPMDCRDLCTLGPPGTSGP